MQEGSLLEAITGMRAAYDTVAALGVDTLTHPKSSPHSRNWRR